MVDINNTYSNDCLYDCKELIRKHISSSSLNINCEDIISVLYEPIDTDKFKAWLDRNINTFKTKQIIQPYFKKAFIAELNKGSFKVESKVVDCTSLIQALRDSDVKVLSNDTLYLNVLWSIIIRKGMTEEQAKDLNRKIIAYLKKGQTFADYIELVKNSKALKPYEIDWAKVQTEYEIEEERWNKLWEEAVLTGVENYDR